VQGRLGAADLPQGQSQGFASRDLSVDRSVIIERMQRVTRCLCECKALDRDAVSLHTALELTRCLAAGAWDHRPTQLTQINGIGPAGMRKLVAQNVRTVRELAEKQAGDIDRLFTRNPPFGKNMSDALEKFPRLTLDATVVGRAGVGRPPRKGVVVNVKACLGYSNRVAPSWISKPSAITFMATETAADAPSNGSTNGSLLSGTLAFIWRGTTKKLTNVGHELLFEVELSGPHTVIVLHLSCEEIVGTIVSRTLQPGIPAAAFPPRATRTPSQTESLKHSPTKSVSQQDMDDTDDNLLVEAALRAEADLGHQSQATSTPILPTSRSNPRLAAGHADVFVDVDDVVGAVDAITYDAAPVQLPNGRWRCNHICSGAGVTRSGKTCHHKCCREGLRKPPKKTSKKRSREEEQAEPNSQKASSQAVRKKVKKGTAQEKQAAEAKVAEPALHPAAKVYKGGYGDPFDVIDLSMVDDRPAEFEDVASLVRPRATEPEIAAVEEDDFGLDELHELERYISMNDTEESRGLRDGANDAVLGGASGEGRQSPDLGSPFIGDQPNEDAQAELAGVKQRDAGPGTIRPSDNVILTPAATTIDPEEIACGEIKDAAADATQPMTEPEPEPEWLKEIDPEIVEMFRGYVTFEA
jgi:ATP-dependent DNA helicase HFM1/MER3